MSLLRSVRFRLRKDPEYRFQAHAHSPYPVEDTEVSGYAPGHGGIRVRSGWTRGNRFRRYAENIGSRSAREPDAWKDFRAPPWARHLDGPRAVIDTLTGAFRPFTPVLLIDGRPAATGFGEGTVTVPAGRRLVQLQSGASGPYRVVDVPEGGTVDLDAITTRRRNLRCMEGSPADSYADMALGPRGRVRIEDGLPHRSFFTGCAAGAALLILMLVFGGIGPMPDFDTRSAATLVPLAITVFTAMALRAIVESSRRSPPGEALGPEHTAGIGHRVLDPADTSAPEAAPGEAVLRVHAVYRQERHGKNAGPGKPTGTGLKALATDKRALERRDNWRATGEPAPPKVRPWAAPPIIRIDGRELPAVWGLNEYRLSPGDHTVEVAVPPPPEELVAEGAAIKLGERATMRTKLPVRADRPATVGAYARIRMTPARNGTTVKEYRGTIRPA